MSNEELVAGIQAGEKRMGELWGQVENLVKWKAARHTTAWGNRGGVEFEDLMQSGYLALTAAAETYDPTAGGTFSNWFMYYLQTAFSEMAGYRTKRGMQEPLNNAISLETPLTDDPDSGDLMEVIEDPDGLMWRESIEDALLQDQLAVAVRMALDTLPEEYRTIVRLRYWDNLPLWEVGERIGATLTMVRQLEKKALRHFRQPEIASSLYPFWDFSFYTGTGLGSFRHSGQSVQERYLIAQEDMRERKNSRQREQATRKTKRDFAAMMGDIDQSAEQLAAQMSQEEKERLLREYGLL